MNGNVSQKRIIRIQIPYKNKEKKIMKITVITGSPRNHGNSFAMTEAFIEEAIKCGHTIQRFDAVAANINGCHACMSCYKTGKACAFNPSFDTIASSILESEAIV